MNKLKGYRVMAGYTQQEVADAMNVSRHTYMAREKGKYAVSEKEQEIILNLFRTRLPKITKKDLFN